MYEPITVTFIIIHFNLLEEECPILIRSLYEQHGHLWASVRIRFEQTVHDLIGTSLFLFRYSCVTEPLLLNGISG